MNNKITKYLFAAISVLLFSCSDWTDPESIDIDINRPDGKLKEEYYKDLRAYKETDHKITYLWFDNSTKVAQSNGQLLTSVPDSVDIVCLSNPFDLTEKELTSMKDLKAERSYSYAYSIDVEGIKTLYSQLKLEASQKEEEIIDLPVYMQDTLDIALKPSSNFDGLVIRYVGKDINFLTEEEKAEYEATEEVIIKSLQTWLTANASKFITIQGYPQNLSDKTILSSAKHIILETATATSKDQIIYTMRQASITGVPTDKFVIAADAISFVPSEPKVGYWPDQSGNFTLSAIQESASVVASSDMPHNILGLSINKGSNDYYNSISRYLNVNKGIQNMNPSLKN